MPMFVWKASDSKGKAVVERIEAANAAEAHRELSARGLINLRLQQDEFATAAVDGVKRSSDPKFEANLSPEEDANYFDGKIPGFWQQWWTPIKKHPLWELTWLCLLACSLYTESHVWAGILAIPLLLFPVLQFWFGMPSRIYNQLNRAKVWSRWADVLALANRLESVQKLVRIGVPVWEIARCRGQALAGLDRLEEGINAFARFETDRGMEKALYQCHLASIYDVAKEFEKSRDLRSAAAAAMPTNMSTWIDLSMHYAHRMRQHDPAQVAFSRIDVSLVPELGRPYLELVQAMMLSLERRFDAAKPKLEAALLGLNAYKHNPLSQSVVLLTNSYLCLCCANLGETAEAKHLWKQVRPYLEAAREAHMLQDIRLSLGEHT